MVRALTAPVQQTPPHDSSGRSWLGGASWQPLLPEERAALTHALRQTIKVTTALVVGVLALLTVLLLLLWLLPETTRLVIWFGKEEPGATFWDHVAGHGDASVIREARVKLSLLVLGAVAVTFLVQRPIARRRRECAAVLGGRWRPTSLATARAVVARP